MADSVDFQDKLNQLKLDLLRAEKRQKLEHQKIQRLVKKSELSLARCQEQLRNNEHRIHAWILQKSRLPNGKALKFSKSEYRQYGRYHAWNHRNNGYVSTESLIGVSVADIERFVDLPAYPALHNLFVRRHEIENALKTFNLEVKEAKASEIQIKKQNEAEAISLLSKIDSVKREIARSSSINASRYKTYGTASVAKSKAPKMDIENWEDAENFAVKYMRWLGFTDARKTRAGSDEGKDVESSKAVAQVKDMGTGVSRPMLQQLFGVAAAEKKIPVFFARSYAKTAKEWGQKHGMALFQFSIRGDVKAVSTKAEQILKKK